MNHDSEFQGITYRKLLELYDALLELLGIITYLHRNISIVIMIYEYELQKKVTKRKSIPS